MTGRGAGDGGMACHASVGREGGCKLGTGRGDAGVEIGSGDSSGACVCCCGGNSD